MYHISYNWLKRLVDILFECSSRLNSNFNTMSEMYDHLVRVLPDAQKGSPVDVFLQEANCTTLHRLKQIVRKSGLQSIQWTNPYTNKKESLTDNQYEELEALSSYLNWLQNGFGPDQDGIFDITQKSRDNFESFIGNIFEGDYIKYNYIKALTSSKRQANNRAGNVATTIPSSPTTSCYSIVKDFTKSIKRSIDGFPDLTKDSQ